MNNIKGLIFDMDGLMIDSESLYFETEREMALKRGKVVEDRILRNLMGRKPIESMQLFKEFLNEDISAEELLKERDRIFTEKLRKNVIPMDGLYNILAESKKYKKAIATGSIRLFVDIVLDTLQIREYFDVIQTSEEITKGKPDPEIYLLTCKKLGLLPDECVVLEDSENGVKSAKSAGCFVIAIPNIYSLNGDFSSADYIVDNLKEASKLINF